MTDNQPDESEDELTARLNAALKHDAETAPAREAEYEATKAYWIARGRAEDAGVPAEQAHALGRQAYERTYGPARVAAEADAVVAATEWEEGDL
jgi:hypothetical protein